MKAPAKQKRPARVLRLCARSFPYVGLTPGAQGFLAGLRDVHQMTGRWDLGFCGRDYDAWIRGWREAQDTALDFGLVRLYEPRWSRNTRQLALPFPETPEIRARKAAAA